MENKILVVDIETTGFLNQGGHIAEIGIVELDLQTGAKEIIFDEVCHEKGMTLESVQNSWIVSNGFMTVEEIRHSKNLEVYRSQLQDIFNQYRTGATAYNRSFDFDFLESRRFQFPAKLPCPMELSTDICKVSWNDYYQKWKWPKVEEAYDFFFPDNDYTELHRGADDAFHEADIVMELYRRGVLEV
ncbi:3'-5' exonuclease family protein [Flammeovirga kamogawensis]|uniref:3'-5' exonuclease n=1 Tax=Flammeovirga kamogawensis TaxID=373891 RepID=A0ABX8H589_9BACT|nr:exonuclease domain-containing protein [Flammeovirga kamogawensis]MBB6463878.1 DNA polymerase-3 subunit epsilon [Flammeovirga kamogawensis]QWG10799.1 hypothetical protein KM029_26705 [Flammeovirga kamogawensis]TRX63214.1 hypothetical protein EO216_26525 [Flammeovirga kamogawensis]